MFKHLQAEDLLAIDQTSTKLRSAIKNQIWSRIEVVYWHQRGFIHIPFSREPPSRSSLIYWAGKLWEFEEWKNLDLSIIYTQNDTELPRGVNLASPLYSLQTE